jgi:hypothetical protein
MIAPDGPVFVYLPDDKYKIVHIEDIGMERDLDLASKFDRDEEEFIKDMMAYEEETF